MKQEAKKKFFFLAWARIISPELNPTRSSEKFIAWAKIVHRVLRLHGHFRLSKITLAWARIPPRLGENTLESTLRSFSRTWATVPSLGRNYFLTWMRHFLPQSKEHTCSSKPFSLGRDAVAWANYAENSSFSDNSCCFYYHRATTHASDDSYAKVQLPSISTYS